MSDPDAVIIGAALAAGHDGAAEAVITLRYANGVARNVTFTCEALGHALDRAGITTLEDLCGRPWTVLVPGAELHET